MLYIIYAGLAAARVRELRVQVAERRQRLSDVRKASTLQREHM